MTEPSAQCPVCNLAVDEKDFVPGRDLDDGTRALLAVNARGWEPGRPVCKRCLSRVSRVRKRLASRFPQFTDQGLKVLPTSLRLDAPDVVRGRGVVIAFLDSGFYAHPDLTLPRNRIIEYANLVSPSAQSNLTARSDRTAGDESASQQDLSARVDLTSRDDLTSRNDPTARDRRSAPDDLTVPTDSSWHGMMTSVVAAGNGFLSNGLYRGIASEADLVLLKVGSAARIKHDDIRRGLEWVLDNRVRLNIRVVNVSCGGDYVASYLTDDLSRAAEEATRAGIVVVAAAGNAGNRADHPVLPPASAPSVITVGGLDDKNNLDFSENRMYHSSYGPTIDGLQKPEVIAPGIWLAAPILPGTPTAEQAALLEVLEQARDSELAEIIERNPGVDPDLDSAVGLDPRLLRRLVWLKVRDNNVISGHYKHVDGTSFAAPIVSSIVAQMIEVNPRLTPQQAKLALIKTAARLPGVEVDRQGWGVVNPRAALREARGLKRE